METCRQPSLPPGRLWLWSLVVAVSLAILVAVVSIHRGPFVQHAVLAIHKAQGDIALARESSTGGNALALPSAETELSLARTALGEGRYDAAIAAAISASQAAREIHNNPQSGSSTAIGMGKRSDRSLY